VIATAAINETTIDGGAGGKVGFSWTFAGNPASDN
jgi:hypothetical protein